MRYLVIGGTSGIGAALVQNLSQQGHEIMVAARNQPSLSTANTTYIPFNAAEPSALSLGEEPLDGLAYLPGSINLKPFHRLKREDFLEDLEVNLLGAVDVVQRCLPALKKSASSSIVLFSTVAVSQGMPYHASIAAAKGALEGLGRSLAAELAPAVRVNVIAPSLVDTPLASRLVSSPERKEASANRHALKRIGEPQDVASLAAFLLSPQSSWISGQVWGADGGMSTLRV